MQPPRACAHSLPTQLTNEKQQNLQHHQPSRLARYLHWLEPKDFAATFLSSLTVTCVTLLEIRLLPCPKSHSARRVTVGCYRVTQRRSLSSFLPQCQLKDLAITRLSEHQREASSYLLPPRCKRVEALSKP